MGAQQFAICISVVEVLDRSDDKQGLLFVLGLASSPQATLFGFVIPKELPGKEAISAVVEGRNFSRPFGTRSA